MREIVRALAVLLGLGLVVGGCSGDDDAEKAAAPTTTVTLSAESIAMARAAAAAKNPECSIVAPEVITEKLGMPVQGPFSEVKAGGTVCEFNKADGSPAATLQLNGTATAQSFAAVREGFVKNGAPVVDVPGVGDEAYAASFKFVTVSNTLAARKANVEVIITSNAPAEQIRALMDAVLARAAFGARPDPTS